MHDKTFGVKHLALCERDVRLSFHGDAIVSSSILTSGPACNRTEGRLQWPISRHIIAKYFPVAVDSSLITSIKPDQNMK